MACEWASHPTFASHAASTTGKVRNESSGQHLRGSLTPSGYKAVSIGTKVRGANKLVHRVVWECFNGQLSDAVQLHHKNGDKLDNRLTNLVAMSATEHNRETAAGSQLHKKSGLSRTSAVRRIDPDNPAIVEDFPSMAAAAEATGIDWWNVGNAIKQHYTYAGYRWERIVPPDLPGEYWACPLRNRYRGLEVSSCGRIRSIRKNVTYGQRCGRYKKINFMRKTYLVHRIVCETFHGPAKDVLATTVDHVNRDPVDNAFGNLRWATHKQQAVNRDNGKV